MGGSVNAIALYKGSKVNIDGDININQIIAGSKLTKQEVSKLILPNPSPFVCSIFIGPNSDSDINPDLTPIIATTNDFTVFATDLFGYDSCNINARVGNMDNVFSPETLLGTATIINGDLVFSFSRGTFRNAIILLASSIFVAVIIILCKSSKKICNEQQSKLGQYKQSITYGSF